MECCICGPVKNCAPYLSKVLDNMAKIGSLFDNYQIVIYYDESSDNSLQILKEYQETNPKMLLYVNKNPMSRYRTHNLAIARNFCLQYIRQNKDRFPYFIMMDCDDVNCKEVNTDILKEYLYRNDWDGLSFNTSPSYYDIWGLSIWPYCFSYNHFNDNFNHHEIIKSYVMSKLMSLNPGQILPCISSFNGFSIYRTNKFLKTYYDGRVRLDLFPKEFINAHAKSQKSRNIVYRDYGHIKGKFEDCEHRAFHQMARVNSGARIMISPKVMFN